MTDFEDLLIPALVIFLGVMFLPAILGFGGNGDEQEECELEWVECTDDDLIGDCELFEETITIGPYWNKTTETKITLRKQVCKE